MVKRNYFQVTKLLKMSSNIAKFRSLSMIDKTMIDIYIYQRLLVLISDR